MPKPYDAVTKHLIDLHPADWLSLLGVAATDAEAFDVDLLDTDLSTITSQADRVLRINGPSPRLQHIELETGHHGSESPRNPLRFSVLVSSKYNLPVESTIVLLKKEADSPALPAFWNIADKAARSISHSRIISSEYGSFLPSDCLRAGSERCL